MRAVERTLRILEILADTDSGVRLTDVCRVTGFDGATALRYLNALIRAGYAAVDPGDRTRYRPGYRLAQLGGASRLSVLQQVSRPHMESLCRACGEDVNLGTLDAGSALCLETQKSSHILGANFASGLRVPAQASSLGKAILAFLPDASRRAALDSIVFERFTPNTIMSLDQLESELVEVRRRGYSVDREEFTPGVVCIGAPIFDAQGKVIAALSITAPIQRLSLERLRARYSSLLCETCANVSSSLARPGGARGEDRGTPA